MAPAGLYAVLRSRRTYAPASQGKLTAAALRGTCFYPWRSHNTTLDIYMQSAAHNLQFLFKIDNIYSLKCKYHHHPRNTIKNRRDSNTANYLPLNSK